MTAYLPRTLEKVFAKTNRHFKALMLVGMPGVGKTTMLKHLAESDRTFVTLDDLLECLDARLRPNDFLHRHGLPICIDKIQRAPDLLTQLKAEMDAQDKNGTTWLTALQSIRTMKHVGDSLAGRIAEFELMPLSIYEFAGLGLKQLPYVPKSSVTGILPKVTRQETIRRMWLGAWPQVLQMTETTMWRMFYRRLVQEFLEIDIGRDLGIEKLDEFLVFLRQLALRSGQELRVGSLAQAVGVSEPTIKNWLSIARACGVIYYLKPFSVNIGKQLVKSPKIYLTDTGLMCYLCGLMDPKYLENYPNVGAVFETFAVNELLKSWVHNGREPEFYFVRDSKTQQEVDLLIRSNNVYHPVEIKLTDRPETGMLKNFSMVESLGIKIGQGALICTMEKSRWLTDKVLAHSIWEI